MIAWWWAPVFLFIGVALGFWMARMGQANGPPTPEEDDDQARWCSSLNKGPWGDCQ